MTETFDPRHHINWVTALDIARNGDPACIERSGDRFVLVIPWNRFCVVWRDKDAGQAQEALHAAVANDFADGGYCDWRDALDLARRNAEVKIVDAGTRYVVRYRGDEVSITWANGSRLVAQAELAAAAGQGGEG